MKFNFNEMKIQFQFNFNSMKIQFLFHENSFQFNEILSMKKLNLDPLKV